MLVGNLLPNVTGYTPIVRVNGTVRAVAGVSWDTEMTGDLPDQVIASGGLGGASGTISWAPQSAVQSRPVSPWAKVANWPPSPGDLVQVQVSDGETTWTRFTGVIDKTTGDPTSGFQSKIIDYRDQITGTFTHEALLRYMPPYVEDGAYRSIGLDFWHPLAMAFRASGMFNVPGVEARSAVSVPFQGSAWPEAGAVRDCSGAGTGTGPTFYQTDFGYGAAAFSAEYHPRLSEDTSTPVQVTLVIPGSHSGVATFDIAYGARKIRLRVNESRGVTAFFSPTGTTPWTTVTSAGGASGTTVVQLLVKAGTWTLRTSNGRQGTGSQSLGSGSMEAVSVFADADARVAGFQVSHPSSSVREFVSLDFSPSMRFQVSGLASTMDMMPALRERSVSDLVDEIMAATLTASWWDETGTLILRPSNLLRGTDPSQTLTTLDDITSLSWEDSLRSVRSAVDVTWKRPLISKGRQDRIELWRGRGDSLDSTSDPRIDWVTPESGVEWFGVDRSVQRLNASNWGVYNSRRGSFCGVWLSNSEGDPDTRTADISIVAESLSADSLKIVTAVQSMISALEANQQTHPEATALKSFLRGVALPVVRGKGRGEWEDATYSATAGLPSAARLQHDLGYWGHELFAGGSVAQRIGDYLAQMVTAPQPTIPGLGVIYDPRRQVGDVYTIRSEWLGIELRVLVTGISEDHEAGGASQSLTVRVISATNIRPVTYDDLAAAWDSGNYASLSAAWAALTYNDMAADPLRGAPS